MARFSAATACLLVILLGAANGREAEDARLIAARSTVTVISVSTSIVQVPFTCRKAIATTLCGPGRKRRSLLKPFERDERDVSDALDSSLTALDLFKSGINDEQARLQVTVWATTTSPFTLTSTTTTGVTISLSFFCTLPLQSFPPAC